MKKTIIFLLFILKFSVSNTAEFNIDAKTAILQDYLSGEILYEKDSDMSIYPASMTKIMTSIIAFDLIKKGQLSLDEKFIVSENAWRLANAGYSSMFIMVGDEVSVENLLRGIIVASGNDACVTLAEGIAVKEIGSISYNYIKNKIDSVITVSDTSIEQAIAMLALTEKVVVEGAGAVGLAAIIEIQKKFKNKNVCIILCG